MKSTSVLAGLLASVALAQPHNRHRHQHEKKDVVVEWVTEWETVTEIIDEHSTQTVFPEHAATSSPLVVAASPTTAAAAASSSPDSAGQFFEPSTPTPTPSSVAPVAAPSSAAPVEAPSSTFVAPPVVTTSAAPVVSSPAPVETPTTTAAAPPAASTSASTGSGSGSGSGGELFTGDLTYYTLGPTACGDDFTGQDSSLAIVALPYEYMGPASSYGPNQPANSFCGKTITISANGKTATAKIQDKCMGCMGKSIDVSEMVFLQLFGSLDAGRTEVSWSLNN